MTIKFYLVDPRKKDTSLRVVITHQGRVYRKATGISIRTASWSQNRQKCAVPETNKRITRIFRELSDRLDERADDRAVLSAIAAVFEAKTDNSATDCRKGPQAPNFWAYFRSWADRPGPAQRQRKNIVKLVSEIMGDADDWADIDSAYYLRLLRALEQRGYSKNYQGSVISKIRAVMHEGHRMKYHDTTDYIDFHKVANETDSVYLTEDELTALWELDGLGLQDRKARDLFLLGCYTGARFGDYASFSKDNIAGDEFRYIQHKTGQRVILPCSPRVVEILERNGGKAPKVHQIVFNRAIKDVCRLAGIDTPIQVRRSKGTGYIHEVKPKYALVSSHTARRTCCTLLAKAGVPINEIMLVSGHRSLQAVQRYLRQSAEDAADRLKGLEYFK